MIASNLGQIIGRLMLQAGGEAQAGAPAVKKRTCARDRRARIIEHLRKALAPSSVGEVAQAMGITGSNASVVLMNMVRDGELRRTGERGHYRYRVP